MQCDFALSVHTSDWITQVANDISSAHCKYCCTVLPAHYAGLCNHARSLQHIRNKASSTLTDAGGGNNQIQGVPKVCDTASPSDYSQSVSETTEAGTPGIALQKSDFMKLNLPDAAVAVSIPQGPVASNLVTQPEVAKNFTKRVYHHRFSLKWNEDPLLKEWVKPVPGDVYKAMCSWCNVVLPANLRLLKQHAKDGTHMKIGSCEVTDNMSSVKNATLAASATNFIIPLASEAHAALKREKSDGDFDDLEDGEQAGDVKKRRQNCSDDENDVDLVGSLQTNQAPDSSRQFYITALKDDDIESGKRRQIKQSGCYILSRSQWDRYRQKYRQQWEADPLFQGWLAPVEGDVFKARCLYCRVIFRAHSKDLKDHARTAKHATNVAFGKPCSAGGPEFELPEPTPHWKTMSRKRLLRPKKCSRFDRTVSSQPLAVRQSHCNSYTDAALLAPDESLATHGSLVAMALSAPGYQPASNVTTLLMPDASKRLDELVSSSLPSFAGDDSHHILRVMKVHSGRSSNSAEVTGNVTGLPVAESDHAALIRLARTVTLWEFLKVKYDRRQTTVGGMAGAAATLSGMLSEIEMLQHHFRRTVKEQLAPIPTDTDNPQSASNILVIQSEEMAQFLGIKTGKFVVKDPGELLANQTMRQQQSRRSNGGRTMSKRGRRPKAGGARGEPLSAAVTTVHELNLYSAADDHQPIGELDSDVAAYIFDSQSVQCAYELADDASVDGVVAVATEFAANDGDNSRVEHYSRSTDEGRVAGASDATAGAPADAEAPGAWTSSEDGMFVVYMKSNAESQDDIGGGETITVQTDGATGVQTLTPDLLQSLLSSSSAEVRVSTNLMDGAPSTIGDVNYV